MRKATPINEEIELDPKRYIVSRTNEKGIITFANPYFCKISGYTESELLGQPHNIVRHPDMPRIIFKIMWERIKEGKNFIAVVKNMAKDGRYYWIMTDFEPKISPLTNSITGYTAYRKAAPRKAIEIITPIYDKLLNIEANDGMKGSEEALLEILAKKKMNYDEFVDDITENRGVIKSFFAAMKKAFE